MISGKLSNIYEKLTGLRMQRRVTAPDSAEELDQTHMDTLSRLYYDDLRRFKILKRLLAKNLDQDQSEIWAIMGFIHYIDCEFDNALECFQKVGDNDKDLEIRNCIAFCYRQLGNETEFNRIMAGK